MFHFECFKLNRQLDYTEKWSIYHRGSIYNVPELESTLTWEDFAVELGLNEDNQTQWKGCWPLRFVLIHIDNYVPLNKVGADSSLLERRKNNIEESSRDETVIGKRNTDKGKNVEKIEKVDFDSCENDENAEDNF